MQLFPEVITPSGLKKNTEAVNVDMRKGRIRPFEGSGNRHGAFGAGQEGGHPGQACSGEFTAGANFDFFILLQGGKGCAVVWFLGDFGNLLIIDDFAVTINDDNGPGQQAGERSAGYCHPVLFTEGRAAEHRQ